MHVCWLVVRVNIVIVVDKQTNNSFICRRDGGKGGGQRWRVAAVVERRHTYQQVYPKQKNGHDSISWYSMMVFDSQYLKKNIYLIYLCPPHSTTAPRRPSLVPPASQTTYQHKLCTKCVVFIHLAARQKGSRMK